MIKWSSVLILWILACSFYVQAQDLDVPYVSTPQQVVEGMLDAADVGPGDYVIDLGSGDGRIVIAAAKRGAAGHGVDLNPVRVEEAEKNAIDSGVSDRVMFFIGDLFESDFSQASVVTLYLLTSVNRDLRPQLFEQLEPGTKVVSHAFGMGSWEPDKHISIDNRNIYYWIIPASVEGNWKWITDGIHYEMTATQEFQKVSATIGTGGNELRIEQFDLRGDRVNIIAENRQSGNRFVFSGKVNENMMTGSVQIRNQNEKKITPWTATRNL